jgi:hypothetical protein
MHGVPWWAQLSYFGAKIAGAAFLVHGIAAVYLVLSDPSKPIQIRRAQAAELLSGLRDWSIPERAQWHYRWMLTWFSIAALVMIPYAGYFIVTAQAIQQR